MARYLLDSTTIILASRGDPIETGRLARALQDAHELGITAVVIGEAYSGAHAPDREALARMLASFAFAH